MTYPAGKAEPQKLVGDWTVSSQSNGTQQKRGGFCKSFLKGESLLECLLEFKFGKTFKFESKFSNFLLAIMTNHQLEDIVFPGIANLNHFKYVPILSISFCCHSRVALFLK